MKKIFSGLLIITLCGGCEGLLNENPNKSGSSVVYHMDQLYAMMGTNFGTITPYNYTWMETLYANDDCDISPNFYVKSTISPSQYGISVWNTQNYLNDVDPCSWYSLFSPMATVNTVLDNIDKVQQTTKAIYDEVKGEALFLRAYLHFNAIVVYSKHDMDALGMGYKTNVLPGKDGVPARGTVQKTIDNIRKDLADAEVSLTSAGRTNFEAARKFRATVPTVKALQARVELYLGNYEKALECANEALSKYSELQDIVNDPNYKLVNKQTIRIMDGSEQVGSLTYTEIDLLKNRSNYDEINKFKEWYYPHWCDLWFSGSMNMSESLYNIYDRENDQRYVKFWANNSTIRTSLPNLQKSVYDNLKPWEFNSYLRFVAHSRLSVKSYIVGPTTAEMYLIKAECLARDGEVANARAALISLRNTRFSDGEAAANIAGTLADVLDERRRELHALRWYDIKRLNANDKANISIVKVALADPLDKNSTSTVVKTLQPNDPFWAIPIPSTHLNAMGWEQN